MSVDRDALTVVMTLAPGVYSRNRYFVMFRDPMVSHARGRAAVVRGIVRQLGAARGQAAIRAVRTGSGYELRYDIPALQFSRTVELSALEYACLMYLGARAELPGFAVNDEEKARLHNALQRMAAEVRDEALAAVERT